MASSQPMLSKAPFPENLASPFVQAHCFCYGSIGFLLCEKDHLNANWETE
jgi:hypothetical protein